MNFRTASRDEPEINLIPFIDVLLVVLIFLMLTTTYSKFTEIQIQLPVADTETQRDYPKELLVSVSSDGAYAVNAATVVGRSPEALASAIAGGGQGRQGHGRRHQRRRQRQAPVRGDGHGSRSPRRLDPDHLRHPAFAAKARQR